MKITTYEMGPNGLVPIDVPANSIINNLKPGSVLHWGGNQAWAAQDYAVIRREVSSFDGGVMYDLIALDGYGAQRVEAYSIKSETDPKVWHSQHFFLTEQVLTPDEILDLIERSKVKKLADEATKTAEVSKFDADKARLRAAKEWAYLAQSSESVYAGHVLAAKNIKRELAKNWPSVKFSVRSKSYSGGNNISVHWVDGPTSAQVDKILNKYEGGSFDGMIDLYTHSDTPWTEVFGSSKYIHGSRTVTRAMILKALAASTWAGDDRIKVLGKDESAYIQADDRSIEHWACQVVSDYDATNDKMGA